jgi:hypothetical protein
MSYAKRQINFNKGIKADVIGITGMADGIFEMHSFETACHWADTHCVDNASADWLKSEPLFWGWWAVEFAKINQRWFDEYLYVECRIFNNSAKGKVNAGAIELSVAARQADGIVKFYYEERNILTNYLSVSKHLAMDCRMQRAVLEGSFHRNLIKREAPQPPKGA